MKVKFSDLDYEIPDFKERSRETAIKCEDVTLTQQHMAEETNINTIVKRFGLTGTVPVGVRLPTYGDFTGVNDYQTALNAVMQADNVFNALPADIRSRFDNNPEKFVDFCLDKNNIDELRKMGLAKPAEVAPVPEEMVQNQAEAGAAGAN